MMLVKIKDRWVNPAAITHLTGTVMNTRVHLLSGTYADIPNISPTKVAQIIADAQRIV